MERPFVEDCAMNFWGIGDENPSVVAGKAGASMKDSLSPGLSVRLQALYGNFEPTSAWTSAEGEYSAKEEGEESQVDEELDCELLVGAVW